MIRIARRQGITSSLGSAAVQGGYCLYRWMQRAVYSFDRISDNVVRHTTKCKDITSNIMIGLHVSLLAGILSLNNKL